MAFRVRCNIFAARVCHNFRALRCEEAIAPAGKSAPGKAIRTLEEPGNHRFVELVRNGASNLLHSPVSFIVAYLVIHGVLKLALALVLLRGGGRWIFPVAAAILVSFIGFMSWHLAEHWSNWVLGFALFDFVTLLLVLNEWRQPARQPFYT